MTPERRFSAEETMFLLYCASMLGKEGYGPTARSLRAFVETGVLVK